MVSPKTMQVLVMGVVGAVGALLWSNATQQPLKNADTFAAIQQQTTEIRTTVVEMKTLVASIADKQDQTQKQQGDLNARVTGLETTVKSNSSRLDKVEGTNGK